MISRILISIPSHISRVVPVC